MRLALPHSTTVVMIAISLLACTAHAREAPPAGPAAAPDAVAAPTPGTAPARSAPTTAAPRSATDAHAGTPQPATDLRTTLDPLARSLVDGQYCGGIVIALVRGAGPTQFLAWGETTRGSGVRPDANTVYEIGSVTKTFTSLLLAELVLDGEVTLDTPVARLLPPGTALPASQQPITLLDLATHTSGLPSTPDNLTHADPGNPFVDYTPALLYAFLAKAKLAHEPGAGFAYSNLGAGLLGEALAQRAQTTWEALVTTRVIQPLGMTSTMAELTDDARARFAQPYDADGEPVQAWDVHTLAGAGALRSTARDLAIYLAAELGVSRATSRLARAMAMTQQPQRDRTGPPPIGKIGLGWLVDPDGMIWHNGGTGGFRSYVAFHPGHQIGVAVLVNGAPSQIDALGQAAMAGLRGEPVPAALDLPPPDQKLSDQQLDRFVGTYLAPPGRTFTITRTGDKLYVQPTGQPRIRIHPISPTELVVHVLKARIAVDVDAQGNVTGLVMHQGSAEVRARRQ